MRPSAFTLVEMLVVLCIIMLLLGIGVPGLVLSQKRTDEAATVNLLRLTHLSLQRCARQYGSGNDIHGFTLAYTDTTSVPGSRSAPSVMPWVIRHGAVAVGQAGGLVDEIGRVDLWNAAATAIEFVDRQRPAGSVVVDGVATAVSSLLYLHVAYEPRTGFPHACLSASDHSAVPTLFANISQSSEAPNAIDIRLGTASSTQRGGFTIHASGVAHVAP